MLSITHDVFGEADEVLNVVEKPMPEPDAGQIRLKVVLATIHNHDLWTIRGEYGFKPELPSPAGTEVLGVVDKLGEGVTGLQVGQRVVSAMTFGTWAEYAVVPAASVVPVPDAVPDEAAAQLVSMPFSAISLLDYLGAKEGDWVVLNSANGAVGRLLSQLAVSRGVNIVGLVRRESAVNDMAEQGVANIVSTDNENWRDRVAEITGGAPIVVGVDSVGGPATNELVSLLADNATLVVFGAMGSPNMEISSGAMMFKNLKVVGFWGSKVSAEMDSAKKQQLFGELFQAIGSGKVTLPVDGIFDAKDIREAAAASLRSGRIGKVLVRF